MERKQNKAMRTMYDWIGKVVTVIGTLSNTLFHSSLSVCRFVGKVGLVISRASPDCEGTGRVEFAVSFWHHFDIMFTV